MKKKAVVPTHYPSGVDRERLVGPHVHLTMEVWERTTDEERLEDLLRIMDRDYGVYLSDRDLGFSQASAVCFTAAVMALECFDNLAAMGTDISSLEEWRDFAWKVRHTPSLYGPALRFFTTMNPPVEELSVKRYAQPLMEEIAEKQDE